MVRNCCSCRIILIISRTFNLYQNYPNPFNPTTTIKFRHPQNGFVDLCVYNITGKEVVRLVNKELQSGYHEVTFNASQLVSNIYFYRLISGEFISSKKNVISKITL